MMREVKDLEFVVRAELEPEYQCSVDYTIYEIFGETLMGRLLFQKAGCDGMEPVDDMAQAQVFAHGTVKWDGCSDWEFDIQKDCMIHSCSRESLERISAILVRCWDMTATLCPKWQASS